MSHTKVDKHHMILNQYTFKNNTYLDPTVEKSTMKQEKEVVCFLYWYVCTHQILNQNTRCVEIYYPNKHHPVHLINHDAETWLDELV